MILITSARPVKDCSPAILRNQLRALDSWVENVNHIVYVNREETLLTDPQVTFMTMDGEPFPRIKYLMEFLASIGDWGCICNADIVIGDGLKQIKQELIKKGALCAMSRRFEFEGENVNDGKLLDNGLDFFCAVPSVWKLAARMVPNQYRIGNILWDTWFMGFLSSYYHNYFWDITPCRLVFHPKHEDRRRMFAIDPKQGKAQLDAVRWPAIERRLFIKSVADATGTKPCHFEP